MSNKRNKKITRKKKLPLIVLAGFMGTGKTETGRALAEILGLDFIDTDEFIEDLEEMSVAELFEKCGEQYFRDREEEICKKLSKRSGTVIATGGGTLLNEKNFQTLSQKGQIILLYASAEEIESRVVNGPVRPLLQDDETANTKGPSLEERIQRMLDERDPAYQRIKLRIDTTGTTPENVAASIAQSIVLPYRTIKIRMPLGSIPAPPPDGDTTKFLKLRTTETTVIFGRGILSRLGDFLKKHGLFSRAFLLLPVSVREYFFEQITSSLNTAQIDWEYIPVLDGEPEKNLMQIEAVCADLAKRGADRDSVAVSIGGGVTGDLGGFTASIYMRGINLVHVPTTLLSQVDSSIGGKVGVNHPWAKNIIGCFYPPRFVLTDPCVLRTLPDEEISTGLAEVVKMAIIGSTELFDFIESELSEDPERKRRGLAFLERCISDCVAIKASIIEKDPFDHDERRVLNLGHTLGHALEATGVYSELTHGEAVSIGLMAAMRISLSRGLVNKTFLRRTKEILLRCGLPVTAPNYFEKTLRKSLQLDKKRRLGQYHFVLPVRLGSLMTAKVLTDVTESEMLAALWKGEE